MAVYMAVRGHGRRHNVVMTSSTLGVGIVVIALLWSGAISSSPQTWHSLFGLICPPACLVMVVEMLLSFNTYSGLARHHRTVADQRRYLRLASTVVCAAPGFFDRRQSWRADAEFSEADRMRRP